MKRGNQDVVGEKCVLNDNEKLSFDTNAKNVAWKGFIISFSIRSLIGIKVVYLLYIQLLVLLFM